MNGLRKGRWFMYLVCWNHDCRQTYDAKDFKPTDRDVKCEKCGGTLISPSGKIQLSFTTKGAQVAYTKESDFKRAIK